jgi:uncharacterized protein with HEPN domain
MLPDRVRIQHMLDAARTAAAFARDHTAADLSPGDLRTLGLIRLVEIIGEAARHVSLASRSHAPEIPWQQIVGTRNRLVHGYFDVDLDILWSVLTEDLPPLIGALERLLEQLPDHDEPR